MEGCSHSRSISNNFYLQEGEFYQDDLIKRLRQHIIGFNNLTFDETVAKVAASISNFLLDKAKGAADLGAQSTEVNKEEFKSSFSQYRLPKGDESEAQACEGINKAIAPILLKQREIASSTQIKGAEFKVIISWKAENRYLNPKPLLPEVPKSFNYMELYWQQYTTQTYTDVNFKVNKEVVGAHKFPLQMASHFFRAMFTGEMKEAKSKEPIPFNFVHSTKTFHELMRHLYTGQVDENFLKDPYKTIDLLLGANASQIEALKAQCAKSLEQIICVEKKEAPPSLQAILDIAIAANTINHQGLIDVCKWFFKAHPGFHTSKDLLRDRPVEQIFTIIDTALDFDYTGLEEACFEYLAAQINIDNFNVILKKAINKKEGKLRKICKNFIKKNIQNYNYIYNKRKKETKEEWDLYKELILPPRNHAASALTGTGSIEDPKGKKKEGS